MGERDRAAALPGPTVVGRYVLHAPIARGGMATIHLARLLGAEGFSRLVAAKRLHPHLADDEEIVRMFLDEARIGSKVHHPNVVPVLDVVNSSGEVILVQEYVHGVPLDKLLRAASKEGATMPVGVAVAVMADMLAGLGAAHEAKDELGASLDIVHRDVSPQNLIVGVDGIARLLDFGVAKASLSAHVTRTGVFKGKMAYTAPEQLHGRAVCTSDLYAAAVVLWEALAGRRMYPGKTEIDLFTAVSKGETAKLLSVVRREDVPPERHALIEKLDPALTRALSFTPEDRFASAVEMREALLAAVPPATAAEVSRWVREMGREYLEGREKLIVTEESTWRQRTSAVPANDDVPVSARPSASARPTVPARPPASVRAPLIAPISEGSATLRPSVSTIPEPPRAIARERGRRHAIPAALMVAAALLVGAFALFAPRPERPPLTAPAAKVESELVVAPAPPPPEPPATVSAAPTATPQATVDAGRDRPAPKALRPIQLAPVAPVAPVAPRAAAPAAPPANDCNPPFYFDGKKKVFKPGCL